MRIMLQKQIRLRNTNWVTGNSNWADRRLGYESDYGSANCITKCKLDNENANWNTRRKLDYGLQIGLRSANWVTHNANWTTKMQIGLQV